MIDFLIGLALGALAASLFHRFRATEPAKVIPGWLTSIETKVSVMISDAMNSAIAELHAAIEAAKAKAVADHIASTPPVDPQPMIDAKDAEDVAAVQAVTASLAA